MTIFEDDRSGLVAGVRQEKIQPPLLSVNPESGEVGSAGPDEEKRKEEFEGEVLKENDSHHLQVEEKPSSSSKVVSEDGVVDVDQDDKKEGLIESNHVMISSPRDGQLPFLPKHPYRHRETKQQSAGFHPEISISERIRILNGNNYLFGYISFILRYTSVNL